MVLTVLSSFLRQSCLVFTNVTSALEVFLNVMRYKNPRFIYLLTYLPVVLVNKDFHWQRFDSHAPSPKRQNLAHARRRRDATVELRRVGVSGVYWASESEKSPAVLHNCSRTERNLLAALNCLTDMSVVYRILTLARLVRRINAHYQYSY